MLQLETAWRASRGARAYQEDSLAVLPGESPIDVGTAPPGGGCSLLAVLADGMGGHRGGAAASRLVCQTFIAGFIGASQTVSDRLSTGLMAANAAIEAAVVADATLDGMGSTLVAVAICDRELRWISVGDSPLYLYRRGEIAILNEDHSLAPALDLMVRNGKLTAEQARNDPRRHMLRSAVAGEEIDLIDLSKTPLELDPGDVVVLASDGVHTLEPDEIARVITAYKVEGSQPVAEALIRAVDAARMPFQDNTSVIVITVR
jgi:PPM family protein phosphatase